MSCDTPSTGGRSVEAQLLLFAADVFVGPLEHGEEQVLLAAEVVVEHPLVGPGARGDAVDPRAA